ncbi:MAG: hypothetical protein HOP15_06510 [Planctomycetes bacterium]|nr:hypothetical protein [Planctomycetota bacterium]
MKKGKVTTEELRRGNFARAGLEFAYRVPKDYDPKRTSYPVRVLVNALASGEEGRERGSGRRRVVGAYVVARQSGAARRDEAPGGGARVPRESGRAR